MKNKDLLFNAIRSNCIETVINCINSGTPIDSVDDSFFMNPRSCEVVQKDYGWTPLLLSMSLRREDIFYFLLGKGASTEPTLKDGRGFEYFKGVVGYA